MDNKQAALSKYSAIAKTKQTVFIAVAVASMVVSVAGVSIYFIAQNIFFNAKVLDEQGKSLATIKKSYENITNSENGVEKKAKELKAILESNSDIVKLVPGQEGSVLRLIVDSLPADFNEAALQAGFEKHIFEGMGVAVEGIRVDPVGASNATEEVAPLTDAEKRQLESDPNKEDKVSRRVKPINFSFTVSVKKTKDGDAEKDNLDQFTELLKKMERSIRTFRINSYKMEYGKDGSTLAISGQAYYLPAYDLKLTKKTIKSDEKAVKKTSTGAKK